MGVFFIAMTADILRSHFGFNDPNVINGILSDPGKSASYDREYGQSQGQSSNSGGGFSAPSFNDVLGNAKQLQTYQIEQNQPAIQTLQGQSNDLKTRYDKLVGDIKGMGSVAGSQAIGAANSLLAARGIESSSPFGQQQIAGAIAPVESQFAGLTSQTGVQEQQDLGQLAAQIAALQAGNVPGALGAASGLAGLQNQVAITQMGLNAYQPTAYGNYLYQPSTGNVSNNNLSSNLNGSNIQMKDGVPYIYIPDNTTQNSPPTSKVNKTMSYAPNQYSTNYSNIG